MNKLPTLLVGLAVLGVPRVVTAAAFDGSQSMLCSVVETFECQSGDVCQQGRAEHINLPEFIRIDVAKKEILSTEEGGDQQATPIVGVSHADGMLLLHGADAYHGWSIAIGETGRMTLALSAHRVGFVVFGACTIP
jgi:hypothetical protein